MFFFRIRRYGICNFGFAEQISREGAQRVLELWDVFGGFHTEDVPCPEDESEDDAVESLTEVLANLMFASDEPLLVRVLLRNRSILVRIYSVGNMLQERVPIIRTLN